MKNRAVTLFVLWGLSLFASIGYAQTSNHSALIVKVPFEFVVGNQAFPAGTYKFRSLLNSVPSKASVDVLEVRSTVGVMYGAIVTGVVDGGTERIRPRLVFTRSGGRVFLSEVWEAGKQAGCRLQNHLEDTQEVESETDSVTLIASAESR